MRSRMLILIMLIVVFQLLIYSLILLFGGEYGSLEDFSYDALARKTENSSIYIRSELQEKPVYVQSYAGTLGDVVKQTLTEQGKSIADLQRDGDLAVSLIEASVDTVSALLRRSMVDDAYLILDTGSLFTDEWGEAAMAALYLQKADSTGNGELVMVYGFESVSEKYDIVRHGNWAPVFAPGPQDGSGFDFYYTTLQTARESADPAGGELGYWSRFSKVNYAVTASLKYSLPLVFEDGTVYGILGIGITESALMSSLPSDDSACYVLGYSESGESYELLAHTGSVYGTLLGNAASVRVGRQEGTGVYALEASRDTELLGSIQDVGLYSMSSPYARERWALISVAARSSVLHPLLFLERMMAVSALLSLIAAAVAALLGCGVVIRPLSDLSSMLKNKRNFSGVIRFQPTDIYEIDEITDAITKLHINVQGFSSQVSKMISVADVGLGTFMYNRLDDSVFVGQSLIDVLRLNLPRGEDIMMSRREFMSSITNPEVLSLIAEGMDMAAGEVRRDFSQVHQIDRDSGDTFWIRLGFSYSPNTIIGIVQDITDTMVEKTRIEHERDHDMLTGLLTRHAYYRRIEELFRRREALRITAFIMVDLDNLKHVNDTYGHDFGDSYIKTAADVLKEFEKHGGIVARLSGDEFNICLPGFSSKEEIRRIIADIRGQLLRSSCLLADGTHFSVGACMGVSWYPDDARSRELLMKYADFAMYTVKHSVKGGIAEFDMNAYGADSAKLADLKELDRIIADSKVRYAFQAIVSARTGQIYGYEALMRVQSDIFRSPMELLNIAKASDKLFEIERMTWTRAMADFQALTDAGRIDKNARLFVNSIASILMPEEVTASFENVYRGMLDRVVLELLEGDSADGSCIARKREIMDRWGGQIALDDYGTGYNSEYALLSLQPHIIKIDRSIVSGCDKDADRRMIIENLVKLTRSKGMLVLAEGVETEEEMKTVISCGVDFLQGYYLAYPVFEPKPIDTELTDTIRRLADDKNKEDSL